MYNAHLFYCSYVYISLNLVNKCHVTITSDEHLGINQRKTLKNNVDSVDTQIIRSLEEDSRVSLRKLAHRVGLTPNILHNRLERLEQEGIVLGYVPIIDSSKMGYNLTAIIMIQIEGEHVIEVENQIAKETNVLSVYDITGEYDAVVFAKFRDTAGLNSFLKKLLTERFIKRTTTMIASTAVKEYSKII